MGGAILTGRLLTGWLLDRFFAPRVALALLAIAAFGTFVLAGARTASTGIAGAVLTGLGMGGESDVRTSGKTIAGTCTGRAFKWDPLSFDKYEDAHEAFCAVAG